MKKQTKEQGLVPRPRLLPLVFYLLEKRVNIFLNKKGLRL